AGEGVWGPDLVPRHVTTGQRRAKAEVWIQVSAARQLVKESGETPPHAMAQPRRVLMDGLCEPAVLCTGGVGE
ncbi:unnamed protein product, partial [Lampetra fluviatilis]